MNPSIIFGKLQDKYKSNKLEFYAELMLFIAVVFELGILAYCNLFNVTKALDQDYAQLLYHAKQMGDHNRILLPDWVYTTTGEFDCPMLLAVLFYKITGNVYYAYGLSDMVNIAVWIFVVNKLLDNARAKATTKFITFCLLFTTYDFGTLAYPNMMFIRGSQYSIKALVPLMLITALTIPENKWRSKDNILLFILLYFETFLTAFSSGVYVFVCGIFPVLLCLFIKSFLNDEKPRFRYNIIHMASAVGFSVIGMVLCKAANIPIKSDGFSVNNDTTFMDAIGHTISDFFSNFRAFPIHPVQAASIEGLSVALRWGLIAIILCGLFFIPKAFGLKEYGREKDITNLNMRDLAESLLISVFVCNFIILIIIPSRDRYQLIGTAALMICAAIHVEKWLSESKDKYRNYMYLAIAMLFLVDSCFSIPTDIRAWLKGERSQYQVDFEREGKIIEVLKEHDIEIAYIYNEEQIRAGLLLIDEDGKYKSYYPNGDVGGWDEFSSWEDNSVAGQKNAIIARVRDEMPEYIQENYESLGRIDEYEIMISDKNIIDGITYIADGVRSVDLPTTHGYESDGFIDSDGFLHTYGEGNILTSPDIEANMPFDWEINYFCAEDTQVRVDIYYNGEYLESEELGHGDAVLGKEFNSPGKYRFIVYKEGSGEAVVKQMYFQGRKR
ncbi:hypothetical protein [Butyrivibrio sp.]|uniref:hypothetical protein n=1 Tax=Butyrivibrio sp. TaxID=28121 RepID=UPI0025C5A7DA|nr:hypothetical protein [Butyrivibrio sp.]MBE5837167.1 hypothetical protein [Butyrivibrio sp.]